MLAYSDELTDIKMGEDYGFDCEFDYEFDDDERFDDAEEM